jgi:hypothetical protein
MCFVKNVSQKTECYTMISFKLIYSYMFLHFAEVVIVAVILTILATQEKIYTLKLEKLALTEEAAKFSRELREFRKERIQVKKESKARI